MLARADKRDRGIEMDPVDPIRLSRLYEDVPRVERPGKVRRGRRRKDEYRPSQQHHRDEPEDDQREDVFERSEPRD